MHVYFLRIQNDESFENEYHHILDIDISYSMKSTLAADPFIAHFFNGIAAAAAVFSSVRRWRPKLEPEQSGGWDPYWSCCCCDQRAMSYKRDTFCLILDRAGIQVVVAGRHRDSLCWLVFSTGPKQAGRTAVGKWNDGPPPPPSSNIQMSLWLSMGVT